MAESKTPEQVSAELVEANKKAEEAQKRIDEAQKKLMELSTENATLRKREEDLGRDETIKRQQQETAEVTQEARDIVSELAGDPEKAAAKLAALINKTKTDGAKNAIQEFLPKVESYINKRDYMNTIRMEHPEYKEHEKLMRPMIESKIRDGKMTLEKAIEETMNDFKPLIEKSKPIPSAPAGASGYTGANPVPASRATGGNEEDKVVIKDGKQHQIEEMRAEIEERKARMQKPVIPSRK